MDAGVMHTANHDFAGWMRAQLAQVESGLSRWVRLDAPAGLRQRYAARHAAAHRRIR